MTKHVITIEPNASAIEAAKIMTKSEVGCLVVTDGNDAVGIVTERDMLTKVTAKGKAPSKVKVSQIMSSPIITIKPDDSIRNAAKLMRDNGIRRLIVTNNGKLRGVITIRDITDSIVGTMAELATPVTE
ncbi:MAG: CBS domain-containing protein [Thaumarchaeota archaeon]|nr:CBS domain-containing protein [Nitrososphaerota archaeon]